MSQTRHPYCCICHHHQPCSQARHASSGATCPLADDPPPRGSTTPPLPPPPPLLLHRPLPWEVRGGRLVQHLPAAAELGARQRRHGFRRPQTTRTRRTMLTKHGGWGTPQPPRLWTPPTWRPHRESPGSWAQVRARLGLGKPSHLAIASRSPGGASHRSHAACPPVAVLARPVVCDAPTCTKHSAWINECTECMQLGGFMPCAGT